MSEYTPQNVSPERWAEIMGHLEHAEIDSGELYCFYSQLVESQDAVVKAVEDGHLPLEELDQLNCYSSNPVVELLSPRMEALRLSVEGSQDIPPQVSELLQLWADLVAPPPGAVVINGYGTFGLGPPTLTENWAIQRVQDDLGWQSESFMEAVKCAFGSGHFAIDYVGIRWTGRSGSGLVHFKSPADLVHRLLSTHGDYTLHHGLFWKSERAWTDEEGTPRKDTFWSIALNMSCHDFSGRYLLTSVPADTQEDSWADEFDLSPEQAAAKTHYFDSETELDELVRWKKWAKKQREEERDA